MTVDSFKPDFMKWLFKQTPLVILLLLSNYLTYNYFTEEIKKQAIYFTTELEKKEKKIDTLENKIDALNIQLISQKYSLK